MEPFDNAYRFCRTVTEQLRCRQEAGAVYQELFDHIQDHAEALRARGLEAEAAERAAVEAMGDPVALGKELDRLHSPWPWRVLRFCTTGLGLVLGLLVLFGAMWLVDADKGPPLVSLPTSEEVRAALPQNGGETLRTCAVRGGGRVGDYLLFPEGEALLRRLDPYTYQGVRHPPEYLLVFAVRSFHWQPWLDDLQSGVLQLSSTGGLNLDPAGGVINAIMYPLPEGGRLTGCHAVVVSGVAGDARQVAVTLNTDRGTVRFTVDLREEGEGA